MSPQKAVQRVIAKAGSAAAVAARLGGSVKRQNVEYWASSENGFPAEYCPAIERAFGIPCEKLRDDLTWGRLPAPGWPNDKPLLDVAAQVA